MQGIFRFVYVKRSLEVSLIFGIKENIGCIVNKYEHIIILNVFSSYLQTCLVFSLLAIAWNRFALCGHYTYANDNLFARTEQRNSMVCSIIRVPIFNELILYLKTIGISIIPFENV